MTRCSGPRRRGVLAALAILPVCLIVLFAAGAWTVFGGYRTLEGGADVDAVYAFAWLNAVVGGIGVRF